jgi:alpha-aminoadipic semialdehyde synthase
VRSLLLDPSSSSTSDLHARALRRATICAEGTLETKHEGLYALLAAKKERKRVVILGSGLVAGPAVRLIASRKDIDLIIGESQLPALRARTDARVASNVLESAEALASPYEGVKAVLLDASDQDSLNLLVRDADVVIS